MFVQLNDGSTVGNLQLIMEEDCEGYEEVRKLASTGSSVRVTGTLMKSPAKGQVVDLKCTTAKVLGGTSSTYPLAKKKHNLETLRQIPHLRPRSYLVRMTTPGWRCEWCLTFPIVRGSYSCAQRLRVRHTPVFPVA